MDAQKYTVRFYDQKECALDQHIFLLQTTLYSMSQKCIAQSSF